MMAAMTNAFPRPDAPAFTLHFVTDTGVQRIFVMRVLYSPNLFSIGREVTVPDKSPCAPLPDQGRLA